MKRSSSLITFHLKDRQSDEKYSIIREAIGNINHNHTNNYKNHLSSLNNCNNTIIGATNNNQFTSTLKLQNKTSTNRFLENFNKNTIKNKQKILQIQHSELPTDAKYLQLDKQESQFARKTDKKRFVQLYRIQKVYENIKIQQKFKPMLLGNNLTSAYPEKIVYKFGNRSMSNMSNMNNVNKRKTPKVQMKNQNSFNFKQKKQKITNIKQKQTQNKYNLFSALDEFVNTAINGKFQFACGKNQIIAADQKQLIIDLD